ncbi:hypothetical protein R69746_05957 [Paraburkholderia aspalathi]|uniref:hypothetical protein n=1 Tax=Paraburkholderia aspalathi TaxID=1324617 RepID=UPI00190A92B6|nr:hypothetical protein [Paraburkholderia aspalathi]MBK3842028.1 hypothetical protein [Paraburkholderia aspalathi]CAE6818791.1 hypothetical protein R69746_05957 [Paraburkholderia aspalathi]
MTSEQWLHGVEYLAEVLTLASVLLIWWPAFKVSRALLAARDMATLARRTSSSTIARLAGDLEADARAAPTEFNATDYRMLLVGFAFGALSSAIKLFYLIPASHH